jgi:hypothetical protein
VFDLWWGSTGVTNGDAYDDVGSRAFSQMRDLITPAGGVIFQTS